MKMDVTNEVVSMLLFSNFFNCLNHLHFKLERNEIWMIATLFYILISCTSQIPDFLMNYIINVISNKLCFDPLKKKDSLENVCFNLVEFVKCTSYRQMPFDFCLEWEVLYGTLSGTSKRKYQKWYFYSD